MPRASTTAPSVRRRLPARLDQGPPLVLDGPTGTALEDRGIPLPPPLWSLGAVRGHTDALAAVHRGYVDAGADVVTTATFHAHPRTLAEARVEDPEGLVEEAVAVARMVGAPYVAGGLGPVADCYRPQDVPDDEAWGVLPNGGTGDPRHAFRGAAPVPRAEFQAFAGRMAQEGAAVLGSCCGSPVAFTADAARAARPRR